MVSKVDCLWMGRDLGREHLLQIFCLAQAEQGCLVIAFRFRLGGGGEFGANLFENKGPSTRKMGH